MQRKYGQNEDICRTTSSHNIKDEKVESVALAVLVDNKEIGILMLGSYERTRYLGDEDTTFIEYIRDILEKKLELIDSLDA